MCFQGNKIINPAKSDLLFINFKQNNERMGTYCTKRTLIKPQSFLPHQYYKIIIVFVFSCIIPVYKCIFRKNDVSILFSMPKKLINKRVFNEVTPVSIFSSISI